jgi:hypothetical protein
VVAPSAAGAALSRGGPPAHHALELRLLLGLLEIGEDKLRVLEMNPLVVAVGLQQVRQLASRRRAGDVHLRGRQAAQGRAWGVPQAGGQREAGRQGSGRDSALARSQTRRS